MTAKWAISTCAVLFAGSLVVGDNRRAGTRHPLFPLPGQRGRGPSPPQQLHEVFVLSGEHIRVGMWNAAYNRESIRWVAYWRTQQPPFQEQNLLCLKLPEHPEVVSNMTHHNAVAQVATCWPAMPVDSRGPER